MKDLTHMPLHMPLYALVTHMPLLMLLSGMWGQVLHRDIFKPMPRLPQHEKDCAGV